MMLIAAIVICGVISAVVTRRLAASPGRLAPLDVPNHRSLHTVPTPRTGGVAIVGSTLLVTALAVVASQGSADAREWLALAPILAAATLIAIVSFIDDRVGIGPGVRFLLHGAIATVTLLFGGMLVRVVDVPGIGLWWLGPAALPLGVMTTMWMANLYNFMDGMDGLAGGMAVIGFSTLAALAWSQDAVALAVVSACVSAASLGFLMLNFPPARIFMGDTGAVSLGFLAATLGLRGAAAGVWDPAVPLLIFMPFVFDATITLWRRLWQRKVLWQPHREHHYQQAVLAGVAVKRTLAIAYALMLFSASVASTYHSSNDSIRIICLAAMVVVYGGLIAVTRRYRGSAPADAAAPRSVRANS